MSKSTSHIKSNFLPPKISNKILLCKQGHISPTTHNNYTNLSHCLSVQLAIIQRDTIKTSNTVPGQIVISVFKTNL